MIKVLEKPAVDELLYTCVEGDTLNSIAQKFNISPDDIIRNNPLFSSVYAGCMLWLTDIGRRKIVVQPMQTLYDIASIYDVPVDRLIKINNLKSTKIFVGMQLKID